MAATRGARAGVSGPAVALVVVVLVGCLAGRGAAAEIRRQKNVQVALRAKWAGTPLLLEANVLLSKEWKDLFWDFVDHWKELDKGSECSTAKCCVQKIVEDARSLLNEPLASIFEFSLTLRSASPRLVLYRQLAEESLSSVPVKDDALEQISGHGTGENFHEAVKGTCCWVDTGSALFFNSADLRRWLEGLGELAMDSTGQPELFDFDHVYPRSNITAPVAIFYGAVGTKCFKELHVHLAEASKQDDFSSADYSVHGPKAFFSNMPLSKTLTMNIDVFEGASPSIPKILQEIKDEAGLWRLAGARGLTSFWP